ncbi:CDP-alcohol phosphatidyltransferase family protein [Plantactinospora sp. KBS50]|uniref:CDP-alcohol phosphatidyltransferase family protein n=1 Tax=Plantactinospora sp. KBS50 TaxID=2024580 RepID=UPI000BAB12F7|nr:CDP-alcohol phosphatidyltransferase [Plantactinospora sp. KBS50]
MMRIGPLSGLALQVAVLAGLAGTVGVGPAGWLVALAYGVGTCAALTRGLHRRGATALGPADRVTLTRATLVGGVVALTVDSLDRPAPVPVLVGLTVVALVLDGVDGQVARRTGTVSELGARFDMEIDAVLLMALSGYVAATVAPWALAIGGMRYAFVLASWLLPAMRRPLPPRYWRKVVAAIQGIVLVSVTAGVLSGPLAVGTLLAALALLVESFGRDVLWLWLRRAPRPFAPGAPPARAALPARRLPVEHPFVEHPLVEHRPPAEGRQPVAVPVGSFSRP